MQEWKWCTRVNLFAQTGETLLNVLVLLHILNIQTLAAPQGTVCYVNTLRRMQTSQWRQGEIAYRALLLLTSAFYKSSGIITHTFHRTPPPGCAGSHARIQAACQKAGCSFGFALKANKKKNKRFGAFPLSRAIHSTPTSSGLGVNPPTQLSHYIQSKWPSQIDAWTTPKIPHSGPSEWWLWDLLIVWHSSTPQDEIRTDVSVLVRKTPSIKTSTELAEPWAGPAASHSSLIHIRKGRDDPKRKQDYLQQSH